MLFRHVHLELYLALQRVARLLKALDVRHRSVLMQLFCNAPQNADAILVNFCQHGKRLCENLVLDEQGVFPRDALKLGLRALFSYLAVNALVVYWNALRLC